MPPLHEIAHLAHVELRTPVLEESVEFFTRYLGLTRNGEAGDSVFLRAFDDYEQAMGMFRRGEGRKLQIRPNATTSGPM